MDRNLFMVHHSFLAWRIFSDNIPLRRNHPAAGTPPK
jgi:hypothetical protein